MNYEGQFFDLRAAVKELHARFREQGYVYGEHEALCRLRLALHEWLANLVRHACFGERAPRVHVRIWRQRALLRCVIEDNSNGFDFEAKLECKQAITSLAHALPDGGMGLLLMEASTEHLEYGSPDGGLNRLRFSVRANGAAGEAA